VQDIADRLARVRQRVADAEAAAGRPSGSVKVLLATKTQPAELVAAAFAMPQSAGMLRGENRVQELVAKGPALAGLAVPTHLIGPLQSNKINAALRWVDAVESVADLDLARALASRLAPERILEVMIQVNVSGEPTKSGAVPRDAAELACAVAEIPRLRVTGFMTIGANTPDQDEVRRGYALLRAIRDQVVNDGVRTATELSMGMSGDLEAAIAEGATIVRVGTAVFGPRGA
jgi:pyridoxal phosphate enzyme (YggS family)